MDINRGESVATEPSSDSLNQPFTKPELLHVIKKLKNGKSQGYDNISNKMIKNSPDRLLDLILDYVNVCLQKSLVSESICRDIINPIFKEGTKSNPEN